MDRYKIKIPPSSLRSRQSTSSPLSFLSRIRNNDATLRFSGNNFRSTWESNNSSNPTIRIDGSILNTEELANNLQSTLHSINEEIKTYLSSLEKRQVEFKNGYNYSKFDDVMFNKLTRAISRIDSGKKIIDKWRSEVVEMIFSLLTQINDYNQVRDALYSCDSSRQEETNDLKTNEIKQIQIFRSRIASATKYRTRLLRIENEIKRFITRLSSYLSDLKFGIIHTADKKKLNLNELMNVVDSLSDDPSPLFQVQKEMSKVLSGTESTLNVAGGSIPDWPQGNLMDSFFKNEPSDPFEDIKQENDSSDVEMKESYTFTDKSVFYRPTEKNALFELHILSELALYTDSSKKEIEQFCEFLLQYITHENKTKAEEKLEVIRNRNAEKVFGELNSELRKKVETKNVDLLHMIADLAIAIIRYSSKFGITDEDKESVMKIYVEAIKEYSLIKLDVDLSQNDVTEIRRQMDLKENWNSKRQ